MSTLARYKELTEQDDKIRRNPDHDENEREPLHDEMEPIWWGLSEQEQDEARKYAVHLHNLWTPKELYEEAIKVIKNFPKPHPNDITPPEARAKQLAYWIERRDKYLQLMQQDQ